MKKDQKDNIEMTFEDSFLNSRRAVEVLKILEESEEGNHASQIARDYELDRSTVSRILKKLEARNMVKLAKREQAKYFEPNYQKISEQALNLVGVHQGTFSTSDHYFGAEDLMKKYYQKKLKSLETDKERFPNLRDILIVAPAIELPKYLDNEGMVSEELDEALIVSFRDSLEIGVGDRRLY